METLERNLERLSDISRETDEIFRISQELEAGVLLDNLDRLWQRIEDLSDMPPDVRSHFDALKAWLSQYLSGSTEEFQSINLFPFVLDVLERVKQLSSHRNIRFQVEGKNDLFVFIDPLILQNVVEGLLRNAVENTPDGGTDSLSGRTKAWKNRAPYHGLWSWHYRRESGVHLRWALPHERNGTVCFEKALRLWSRR